MCTSPDRSIQNISHYIAEYKVTLPPNDDRLQEVKQDQIAPETVWTPPPTGAIKINVDTSLPPQAGMVSLGVILQNSNDGVLGASKKTMSF